MLMVFLGMIWFVNWDFRRIEFDPLQIGGYIGDGASKSAHCPNGSIDFSFDKSGKCLISHPGYAFARRDWITRVWESRHVCVI